MPLPLRVFEERYLVMLAGILQEEPSEFGVVLIERGQEVGGGEKRFTVGTVARIDELEAAEGFIAVIAEGDRRFEVVDWLVDDPYPQAVLRELDDLEWDDELEPLIERAEKVVRRALAMASEFSDQQWAADVELSEDRIARAWQLAGIAPLGELDQITLLGSTSTKQLLDATIELTTAQVETFGS
jgi:Lon protease-like protein